MGRARWILLGSVITLGGLGTLVVVAQSWETRTTEGIEWVVQERRVSLYDKALAFLYRDRSYRQLVRDVVPPGKSGEEALLTLLAWTREHVRPRPENLPRIDDHPLNIIIRGYGYGEQAVDVLCVLSTYAGYPCQMVYVEGQEQDVRESFIVAAAYVKSRWVYIDVLNDVYFHRADRRLAGLRDLVEQPKALVPNRSPLPNVRGVPYEKFLKSIKPISQFSYVRGHLQMPLPRILYEAKRRLGLTPAVTLFWNFPEKDSVPSGHE